MIYVALFGMFVSGLAADAAFTRAMEGHYEWAAIGFAFAIGSALQAISIVRREG